MAERVTGTVKWFDNGKGIGFIKQDDGTDVFVHNSELESEGPHTLKEGWRVEFEVVQGQRGPSAENVTIA